MPLALFSIHESSILMIVRNACYEPVFVCLVGVRLEFRSLKKPKALAAFI